GYARVIKKACRARGTAQEIKPDAFAAATAGPAKAKIGCRVGAVDTPVDWTDGGITDPRLGNIFVFDSFSARVHVGEDGPACFKPRGLDVLPELAKACDTIKAELQKEIDATFAENTKTAQGWKYSASSAVGKLVNALGAATKPETIDTAAVFTDADEKRLAEIIATLSTDPKLKAADTTAAAKRIRTFAETAKNRAMSVDDTAMQALGEAIKEAETTAKAAKAAAGPELKDTDLPGSCNDVWRKLWDAAKAYSVADAYPGKTFPVTEADAKCVLCQQTLQREAIDRYARFNNFVADETRKQADASKAKVTALKPGLDSLRAIGTEAAGIKADLDREAAEKFDTVEAFAKAIDVRIALAQKCLKDGTWTDAPALPASPCADLLTLADNLDKRAKDELAAADPEKAKALATERDELTDKKWLADKTDEVKAHIARHAHAAKLKKCQDDCTTNAITIKSGELHESHVTGAFCKAFEEELAALGMKTLRVKLEVTRGAKGEQKFGVRLVDTSKTPHVPVNAKVGEIASEGEHRCIALAAFIAELSQASHKSALVFDDPVSSLDWKYRRAIAKRLFAEAADRQVIVFTHDLAFICELHTAAGAAKGAITELRVERFAGKPGRVMHGLLWDALSVKAQFKSLREDIGKLDKIAKESGDTEYRDAAIPVVGRLRSACERVVEEVLLNETVKRHDSQLHIKQSPQIAAVTADQWKAVYAIHRECSNSDESHAKPVSGPVNVPTPDKLKEWMQVLEKTVEDVRKARESTRGTPITEPKPASSPAPHH
ncbi:MAG: AAA family ATPase, partial [Phycisphaerales bacterium]|nr:AAA family ATPase [Phycisphaerales bacterium]